MFILSQLGGSNDEDVSLVLRANNEKEKVKLKYLIISQGLGILLP